MEAQAYYESLIQQGYSIDQAKQYTVQYYPDFNQTPPALNPGQNLPQIPAVPPRPDLPQIPTIDLPPPSFNSPLSQPALIEPNGLEKKKIIAIAVVGILVIAGAVGIMYALGVFGEGDAEFVGQWVTDDGQIMRFNENGTMVSSSWSAENPYQNWPFDATWEKSGNELSSTYERTVTSEEFPYDEKMVAKMKIKIDGSVMFVSVIESVLEEDYGEGEVYEYDLMDTTSEDCVALISKERFEFTGENWNEEAHNTWYSMVNAVDIPDWCDNEFKNEYSFSFQHDDWFFELTLETSKWDALRISDMAFFVTINDGTETECFYDGYDGVCSYIPGFGSEKIRPGATISFGRAEAWNTDCSSGCDIYVRIVQNTDSGQVLIDEFRETNLVWN